MLQPSRFFPRTTLDGLASSAPSAWAASQVGPREENQDDYGRADHTVGGYRWREKGFLYVVADGLGGLASGGEAASIAVQEVISQYAQAPDDVCVKSNLATAVEHANESVFRYGENKRIRTGSTIVACVLKNGTATIAHVGDSRVYQLGEGMLRRRTLDHLYATEVLGFLDDDEAKRGAEGHKVSRALGNNPTVEMSIDEVECAPGDRFLLCSDGLSNVLTASEITRALSERTPRTAVSALFGSANARLDDNATALVVFVPKRLGTFVALLRSIGKWATVVIVVASCVFGGWSAWRSYGARFVSASLPLRTGEASPRGPKPEAGTQLADVILVNNTGRPVIAWADDLNTLRLIVAPGKTLNLEMKGDPSERLWWSYQEDSSGNFKQHPIAQQAGQMAMADKGEEVWEQVVKEQVLGGHSNVRSKTGRAGRTIKRQK